MEFFQHITTLAYLSILFVTSHAGSLTPQAYWNAALPNTIMPRALKDLIKQEGWKNDYKIDFLNNNGQGKVRPEICSMSAAYNKEASINKVQALKGIDEFFFEGDLKEGRNLNLQLSGEIFKPATFLPRKNVEEVPFNSKSIHDILNHYSVKSNSTEAFVIGEILEYCETSGAPGEERSCATSLESMIDKCISKMGKNIYALSTELERETQLQMYSITRVTKISGDAGVSCHQLRYVHPVFSCHNTGTVRLYGVSMEGVNDGTRVRGVVVCHTDTSYWSPKHLAFQLLKVGRGTIPICHVLSVGHVLWLRK